MPIYKAPVEDVTFLLNEVFQIDRYDNLPGFSDASADAGQTGSEATCGGGGAEARNGRGSSLGLFGAGCC